MPRIQCAGLLIGLLVALPCWADDKPTEPKKLERLWADLASPNEVTAIRAVLELSSMPEDALDHIDKNLAPLRVDAKLFAKLIEQADSDEFEVRDKAARELERLVEYLGKYAKPTLQTHLTKKTSAEVRRRLQILLDSIPSDKKPAAAPLKLRGRRVGVRSNNGDITIIIDGKPLDLQALATPAPPPPPNTQRLRAVRAVLLLEKIGSARAKSVLERLAGGEAEAAPTREAKAALKRLGN